MTQTYTPRVGSVADRAMAHLKLHGLTATRPLADAIEAEHDHIAPSLSTAVKFGAIRRRLISGVLMWSLGDGTPPAPEEAAPEGAAPAVEPTPASAHLVVEPAEQATPEADVTVTIVNQTSEAVSAESISISPTERALIVQEAAKHVGEHFADPNSQMSRSFSKAFKAERRRDGNAPAPQAKPIEKPPAAAELRINGTPSPIADLGSPPAETRRVADAPGPLRIALWSDGTLQLQRGLVDALVLSREETEQLVDYLEQVLL